jgi:hypothetical protein
VIVYSLYSLKGRCDNYFVRLQVGAFVYVGCEVGTGIDFVGMWCHCFLIIFVRCIFVRYVSDALCNIPSGEALLGPCPTPNWWTTPCRLSVTVYPKYSQLLSISGGRFCSHNVKTRLAALSGSHTSCKFIPRKYVIVGCETDEISR